MFMFRFRASLFDYKSTAFYKYLRIDTYIFRAVLLCFIISNCCTYSIGLEFQLENRKNLLIKYPDAPLIVMCPTVIVAAPFVDPVSAFNMILWGLVVLITLTSTVATTVYLRRNLKENAHQSVAVVRMHRMLLITLSVLVHFIWDINSKSLISDCYPRTNVGDPERSFHLCSVLWCSTRV
uniref:G_PROTEIN_RECEP_F1_2 domain-containing protein n=1 Tax=Caenorhabditis tropicalis TaxID=1561998 RepID=A0A1I7U8H2_9PELO